MNLTTNGLSEQPQEQVEAKGSSKKHGTRVEGANDRKLDVRCLADVEPAEVTWLWKPYIPDGKITLLSGDPGSGKTTLALAICASITSGEMHLPEGGIPSETPTTIVSGSVLYFTGEDDLDDTILPRFSKMRGNGTRFFAIGGVIQEHDGMRKQWTVTLADREVIENEIRARRPKLVVIDPIQAYLGAKVDFHRANEVRPILDWIADLARRSNCAFLLIRHLCKANYRKALYQGMGSNDFTASARSEILVGEHPQEPGQYVLAHLKCSNASKGPSLGYLLNDGHITWLGANDLTPEQLCGQDLRGTALKPRKQAADLLLEVLSAGPRPSAEVIALAGFYGISHRTLQRAREQLGVITKPSAYQGHWTWQLPPDAGTAENSGLETGGASQEAVELPKVH